MRYLGGKTRIAKQIAEVVATKPSPAFWDPFCGSLAVAVELVKHFPTGVCSDVNAALINMYRAIASGWEPPTAVSEREFEHARNLPDTDPRKAFIGFGCSFAGIWFRSFAYCRSGQDFTGQAARAVKRDVKILRDKRVKMLHASFMEVRPTEGFTVYCDPPYAGTTGYPGTPEFDYPAFYAAVLRWAKVCDVFVSEYSLPFGTVVMEFPHRQSTAGKSGRTFERLYHVRI